MSEFNQQEYAAPPAPRKAGYAEWLALGAVVAGSVGAIVGELLDQRRNIDSLASTQRRATFVVI